MKTILVSVLYLVLRELIMVEKNPKSVIKKLKDASSFQIQNAYHIYGKLFQVLTEQKTTSK